MTTPTSYGPADAPPVLLLHPWWGVTPSLVEWAQDLAGAGRRVLVPDLFDGRTADTVDAAEALADGLDQDAALETLRPLVDELAAHPGGWALVGFSLGAFLGCRLAGRGPEDVVLFYGAQPPGTSTARRVVLHVAPDDEWFTDEERAQTEAAFRAAGAEVRTHVYEGSRHWFAERGTPGFDEAAHALARTRVLDLLRR
jgi:carboxymethylenebutenolidase